MTLGFAMGIFWVILGLGLVFSAGFWWRDGRKWVSVFSLLGGLMALIGQFTAFLAFLEPFLKV